MEEENVIDQFLQNAQPEEKGTGTEVAPPAAPTDESIVEKKAREGGKQPASPVQEKTLLSKTQLDERIASDVQQHPGLDETALREALAKKIENESISEADYVEALNTQLAKNEEETEEETQPFVAAPPLFSNTWQSAKDGFNRFSDRITSLKTPGGVALLVWILMFFIWVIVPVNGGKTRMQLLWGVLTGQVSLSPEYRADEQKAAIPQGYTGTINIPSDEAPYFQGSGINVNPTAVNFPIDGISL